MSHVQDDHLKDHPVDPQPDVPSAVTGVAAQSRQPANDVIERQPPAQQLCGPAHPDPEAAGLAAAAAPEAGLVPGPCS
jgi:hypothetical protein